VLSLGYELRRQWKWRIIERLLEADLPGLIHRVRSLNHNADYIQQNFYPENPHCWIFRIMKEESILLQCTWESYENQIDL